MATTAGEDLSQNNSGHLVVFVWFLPVKKKEFRLSLFPLFGRRPKNTCFFCLETAVSRTLDKIHLSCGVVSM